jgi:TM2 domain-containing membrane protein YozV
MDDWKPLRVVMGDELPRTTRPPATPSQSYAMTPSAAGPTVVYAAPQNQQLMYESMKKSAGVACLLNLFIPGAGYMYAGMVVMGLLVFILWAVCIPLTFGIGSAIIWAIGLIDGFLAVGRSNRKLALKLMAKP